MEHEHLHEALVDAIKACGGTKAVALALWPAKATANMDTARRYLANCLNPECAEKLGLDEHMLVLRMAREQGNHSVMRYLAQALAYAEPMPIEPKDEVAELQHKVLNMGAELQDALKRLEQLSRRGVRAS